MVYWNINPYLPVEHDDAEFAIETPSDVIHVPEASNPKQANAIDQLKNSDMAQHPMFEDMDWDALIEDIANPQHAVNDNFLLDVLMVAGGYMQEAGDAVGTEQTRKLCKNLCVCLESFICDKLGGDTQIIDDAIAARVRRILDGKHGGYE